MGSKKGKVGDSDDRFQKYSPISELEDENKLHSSNDEDSSDESEPYSSGKFEDSSSSRVNTSAKKH